MTFLDDLPGLMATHLGPHLRPGVLTRYSSGSTDDLRNPIPGTPTAHEIRGIVEGLTRYLTDNPAYSAEIEDDDVAVLMLLHGVPITPKYGDDVSIDGPVGLNVSYRVMGMLTIDPARAHCVVHARPK